MSLPRSDIQRIGTQICSSHRYPKAKVTAGTIPFDFRITGVFGNIWIVQKVQLFVERCAARRPPKSV